MADSVAPILPEVRHVQPGDVLCLCACGCCPSRPDAAPDCPLPRRMTVGREQRLLLCGCGRSASLPYCDGRHAPPASGLKAKWWRFWRGN
ncbi:hypothetical protein D9M68_320610 [compost metagenome]